MQRVTLPVASVGSRGPVPAAGQKSGPRLQLGDWSMMDNPLRGGEITITPLDHKRGEKFGEIFKNCVCACVCSLHQIALISDYCAWPIRYNHARRCRRGSAVHESSCTERHLYTGGISSGISEGVTLQLRSRRTGSELRNSVIVTWSPYEWMLNCAPEHAQWALCGTRGS